MLLYKQSFAKELEGKVTLKRIKLPADLMVELDAQLDPKIEKIVEKDPKWNQKVHDFAQKETQKVVADLVNLVTLFEKNLGLTSDPKAQQTTINELTDQLKKRMHTVGTEMEAGILKLWAEYKKGKAY